MADYWRWDGPDLVLTLKVQPRASRDAFEADTARCRVRITAPPVEGAANDHLARVLAAEFGVGTRSVVLVRGASARIKALRIRSPSRLPDSLAALGVALPLQKHRKN